MFFSSFFVFKKEKSCDFRGGTWQGRRKTQEQFCFLRDIRFVRAGPQELVAEFTLQCLTWEEFSSSLPFPASSGLFFWAFSLFCFPSSAFFFLAIHFPKDKASVTPHGRLFPIKMFLLDTQVLSPAPCTLLLLTRRLLSSFCASAFQVSACYQPCILVSAYLVLLISALLLCQASHLLFLVPKLCLQD